MDFRVKGVTSISADLHKYGCCPKGTSVCLFSDDSPALSVYAALNWSGGLYTKVYGTIGILPTAVQEMVCRQYQRTRLYYEATCSKLGIFSTSSTPEKEMDEPEVKNKLNS